MRRQRLGHRPRETGPVDGEGRSRRNLMRIGRPHDQRPGGAQFGMQKPDGVGLGIVGA